MSVYEDFQRSLYKFLAAETGLIPFNFDAHADLNELPAQDLVGLRDFSIESDHEMVIVETMIAISTIDDTNLFRLDGLIGSLFDTLSTDYEIGIYNSSNVKIASMKVMGQKAILPVVNTKIRPLKVIAISFASGYTG